MKKLLSVLSTLLILLTVAAAPVAAKSTIYVNAGYWKGDDMFDIVVKESPGAKLKTYVNDKNPIQATTNQQGWATFHHVVLVDTGKVSFTQLFDKDNHHYEKPINYTRKFTVADYKVTFTENKPVVAAPVVTAPAPQPAAPSASDNSNLSNNNTYTNSAGNSVHSPAASTNGSIPAGATAQCRDGTYSFSQSRSGTCSHHGGVGSWL
jgi:hypothetical protein